MQPELEGGDDAEVAAAAADGPEQIRVLVGRGPQDPAVGGDDLGGDEVVDGQTELAGQPAHAAAQGQPADAGVTDQPGRHGQPVRQARPRRGRTAARRRRRGPGGPAGRPCTSFIRLRSIIMPSSLMAAPAVLCAPPRTAISSPCSRAKPMAETTSAARRAPGDHGRVPVDLGVPDPAPVIEVRVARNSDLAVQRRAKLSNTSADRLRHDRSPFSMVAFDHGDAFPARPPLRLLVKTTAGR